jgi:PhnB protein
MPKRSLPNRSMIDQLDQAVTALLAKPGAAPQSDNPELLSLLRIAAELRDLPRENFKERLKTNLQRSISMATTTEPIAAVRTTAAPTLTFKDAAKAIEFYTQAFGAKETFRFENEMGIGHAEIMIGDSVIMLAEEWPEGDRFSAETLGQSPITLRLIVPDVDAFVKHAVSAGAKLVGRISDQFYGRRDASLHDPFGYTWRVQTIKEEMSVEEMHRRFREMLKSAETETKRPAVEPVPRGFRTVTPYIIAADGDAMIAFAKKAFGAEETFRAIGAAGGIHGEIRIGDSMVMMGGGIPGREFKATPNVTAIHLYVEDADAVYQQALEAGASSIDGPRDQEYGERSASVKDPAGNYWYIATHKGPTYTPKGLNSVNVYMHPLRAEPVISFLKRAFGARELAKYASPDGVVHHAEIRVGTSVVEMGEAQGRYQPLKSMFYVYLPDCDTVYRRALAAGATSIAEPTDHPYGDRSGGVQDAFGNTWYIATHIKDVSM